MAYDFYKAYHTIATTPQQDWINEQEELVNEVFEYASNAVTVQEQTTIGGIVYSNLVVRLNGIMNAKTGQQLGEQWAKLIFKDFNHTRYLGRMYKFDNKTWITVNTNSTTNTTCSIVIRQCNNYLKWVNNNGVLKVWDCVFDRGISNTEFDYGSKGLIEISGAVKIIVQRNSDTNAIKLNDRFIFDGYAFQVKQIDNHISNTYLELFMISTQVQPYDDLVNNVAGTENIIPISNETKILPQVLDITKGATQSYSIYKYVNGVANVNTFTITADILVDIAKYTLTILSGNTFSVKNNSGDNTILKISCLNNTTPTEITTIDIMLGGAW